MALGNEIVGEELQGTSDTIIFEDENTPLSQLKPAVRKALTEFRCKVEEAIIGNYILGWSTSTCECCMPDQNHTKAHEHGISLWGVPLLPRKGHERTDIVLMKFLRARDYNVHEAFEMLQKTLKWRKEFNMDGILDETYEPELEIVGYSDGTDKEGRPLSYVRYELFQDINLFRKLFKMNGKKEQLLRWRIQQLEKVIGKLDFKNGGVDSVIIILDMKNSPAGPPELRNVARKLLFSIYPEYYPEIIFRLVFINVPIWSYALYNVFSKVLSQRAKSKFVITRPRKSAKTLLKYIAPENLPVKYGGFKRENEEEFSTEDQVSELYLRGGLTNGIEIAIAEPGETVVWDLTVIGWDVSYKEEFVPDDECSDIITIRPEQKLEANVRSSCYIREPGKILLTVHNDTSKKKRVLYRFKNKHNVVNPDLYNNSVSGVAQGLIRQKCGSRGENDEVFDMYPPIFF
ncbi:hypothetical protein GIB67_026857 [Kingdonia uniflora]|uniref:CRAL-TRIO domain-containing protein n=1 Tax=Kingdonia uniflora TaxID=39325 RepID=A0A7J7M7T7_9MAGN|nr:hypothetical protein GIB67_026857 [Kingdonia uniflora]